MIVNHSDVKNQANEHVDLYIRAVDFVIERQHLSCSSLQRHFGINYGLALQLKESIEKSGIASTFEKITNPQHIIIKVIDLDPCGGFWWRCITQSNQALITDDANWQCGAAIEEILQGAHLVFVIADMGQDCNWSQVFSTVEMAKRLGCVRTVLLSSGSPQLNMPAKNDLNHYPDAVFVMPHCIMDRYSSKHFLLDKPDEKIRREELFAAIQRMMISMISPCAIGVDFDEFCRVMMPMHPGRITMINHALCEADGYENLQLIMRNNFSEPAWKESLPHAHGLHLIITTNLTSLLGRDLKRINAEIKSHLSQECQWISSIVDDQQLTKGAIRLEIYASY